MKPYHPNVVLLATEKSPCILPVVDHYAGSKSKICKAMDIQNQLGPIFDITCDCEDGATVGSEEEHARICAELIAGHTNRFKRMGVRIHDVTHAAWQRELEILIQYAGEKLAFITLPKANSVSDVTTQINTIRRLEQRFALCRTIPVHVLIETHGALREIERIATIPGLESLDFGLMDFVSAHHGAIPYTAMHSPGQFEHPLIARAKCLVSSTALANGLVPTHSVSIELDDLNKIYSDARRARMEFAYLRMWSIHPCQIEPILRAMQPNQDEIEHAGNILLAAQEAAWGPIRYLNQLHDRASYRYHWTLLQRAQAMGAMIAPQILDRFFT